MVFFSYFYFYIIFVLYKLEIFSYYINFSKKEFNDTYSQMMTNPLEQFEINLFFNNINEIYNSSKIVYSNNWFFNQIFNNNAFELIFTMITFTIIINFMSFNKPKLIPTSAIEIFFEKFWIGIFNFIVQNTSIAQQPYVPILGIILIMLVIYNFFGLLPFGFTFTAHMIITFFFAFTIFFGLNFNAIKRHQLSYFGIFLPEGTPFTLQFLVVILEIISYFSRPFSLFIRLFANMMAGHALLKIFVSFTFIGFSIFSIFTFAISTIGIIVLFSILSLEFIVAFLQVFVFITLFIIYIKDVHTTSHLIY